MTQEAYRFAVHLSDLAVVSKHNMGINIGICFPVMTAETNGPPVSVRSASEEFRSSFPPGSAVHLMTGQAPDLALEERKRGGGPAGGSKIDGMVVFLVVMTGQTER